MVKKIPKIKPKEKKEILPKRYNQRTYNRLFLGGVVGFVLLAGGAMATNIIRLNAKPKETVVAQIEEKQSQEVNYRLQNWSNSYVYYYFNYSDNPEEQGRQVAKLNSFTVIPMDVKNRGHTRQPSKLNSLKLLEVTSDTVTYLVSYTVNPDSENKVDVVTNFHIPYKIKEGKFYVSDLPYYSTAEDSQVSELDDDEILRLLPSLDVTKEKQERFDEFLKLFFTNYTTSQENLDLVSKDLTVLSGHEFQSLDFSSYEISSDKIKGYAQVTLKGIDQNTRSENFTLEFKKKGSSYEVIKMAHGIKKK